MGPIECGFDGSSNRVHRDPPLPHLLNASPYSPLRMIPIILLTMLLPSFPVASPFFFDSRISWVKAYIYLFVVGWQTTYKKAAITLWSHGDFCLFFPWFLLAALTVFVGSLVAFCFHHIHHAHPTHDLPQCNPPTHHPSTTTIRSYRASIRP